MATECSACDPTTHILENFQCIANGPGCQVAENTLDTEDNICKSVKYDNDHPCPIGKFNVNQGSSLAADCALCTDGMYCKTSAAPVVSGPCAAGYYCKNGANLEKNDNLITGATTTGGRCTIGNYCTASSIAMTSCDEGYFCDQDLLGAKVNQC